MLPNSLVDVGVPEQPIYLHIPKQTSEEVRSVLFSVSLLELKQLSGKLAHAALTFSSINLMETLLHGINHGLYTHRGEGWLP